MHLCVCVCVHVYYVCALDANVKYILFVRHSLKCLKNTIERIVSWSHADLCLWETFPLPGWESGLILSRKQEDSVLLLITLQHKWFPNPYKSLVLLVEVPPRLEIVPSIICMSVLVFPVLWVSGLVPVLDHQGPDILTPSLGYLVSLFSYWCRISLPWRTGTAGNVNLILSGFSPDKWW